jgi:integrase
MAPPRKRSRGEEDRPTNLQFSTRKDGRRYYVYLHPVTGRRHGMGYDKAEAYAAARQLNQIYGKGRQLVERIAQSGRGGTTLGEYAERFTDQVLPGRRVKGHPLSQHYIRELTRVIQRIVEHFGPGQAMRDISQGQIAEYLAGFESPEASNKHRAAMRQLWRQAVSDEVVPENLPERVIPRDKERKIRQRLTLEAYRAIFEQARPSIRHAMELSLNALQRRADVRKWRFEDQRDGFAHIIQQKTRKHGPSAWLRVPLSLPVAFSAMGCSDLGEVIEACRDRVLCPFLVHERPRWVRPSKEKEHHFQLSAKQISDGFADARDATGLFQDMPAAERPTFHEIISLGQHLREQQGWSKQQIQQLRGHTSVKMTEVYLEGHTWTTFQVPGAG